MAESLERARRRRRCGRGAAAFLLGCSVLLAASADTAATRIYRPDPSHFANPERGFSLPDKSPAEARAAGMSLVHVYVRLDSWKDAPLPDQVLTGLARTFAEARAGGVKLVPRFIYNFPKGLPLAPGDDDAPLPRVLAHIAQLRPILRDNADVIAFLEAGFVGAWGEWHHSTAGLDTQPAKKAILAALLDALPEDRAVALRYQRDKIAIFERAAPLGAGEAFSGRPIARVGHHNDCFLASRDDWDTYRGADGEVEAQKAYLAAENRYVPQGGETCNEGKDAEPFIGCANAVAELARLRWSQLNALYHPGVLALWRKQGCYDEIARRLGYRFRLVRAQLPSIVARGGRLRGEIVLVNEGFAAPYNPRALELVLRDLRSGREHFVPLAADPRRWAPGQPHRISLDASLPAELPAGTYAAFLNLPDPAPRLRGRAAYSIRLANRGVWVPDKGYNDLRLRISVRR